MIEFFNTSVVALLSFVAGWAVVSTRVRVSLITLLGLTSISIGFLGLFLAAVSPFQLTGGIIASNTFVHVGLVLCIVGYVKRTRKNPKRRSTDWVDL